MRNICLFITFIECLLPINSWSQQNSKTIDSIPTIYEFYKEILDNGDTVKLKAKTSGYCRYESLTQIIKKNDSTLIVHNITTPCLEGTGNNTSPSTHKNRSTYLRMPKIEDFEYTPYSIEIPMETFNYWDFNLINATGKITIIDIRRNRNTNESVKYTPYSEYDMDFMEFFEFIISTNEKYGIYDYFKGKYRIESEGLGTDLFSERFRNNFGSNPTFYINHMWGVHVTEHFIVLLENIQNGLIINGIEEEDFSKTFIKIAESIKPIDPNIFNLNNLQSYKE